MANTRSGFYKAVYAGGNLQVASVSVSAGDTLVVGVQVVGAITITNVTATGETNVSPLSPQQTGGPFGTRQQFALFQNCAAGTKTVAATLSGVPTDAFIYVWVVAGADTTTTIDGTVQTASGTNSTPTLNLTTSAANSSIFAMMSNNGAHCTAGSGYTSETMLDYAYNDGEYQMDMGAAGSKTVAFSSTTGDWILIAIGILTAGGGGGASPQGQPLRAQTFQSMSRGFR